ncbi:hypothetical protein Gotri_006647 [Gossypium trilobum]|uniref:NADH-ubiquinone oxidoreductase 21kDa subunit N-terminal domain-containing protein n=1 Tax=Gossypium trilobum TaxID=34281 RepID=A0A7J9F0J0_9ROSI|nr:hypothetical protein [Gossypium trilobum]
MNTDITASAKPEYPVVDRNPPFTKVVGNFNTLDYLRFTTITGVSVTVGYLSGIKPGLKGPSMVTGGLIGLMGGFMYAYQNSAGRLMGFFPNDGEVAFYWLYGSIFLHTSFHCLVRGSKLYRFQNVSVVFALELRFHLPTFEFSLLGSC